MSWTGESSGDPAGDEINVSGGSYNITSLSAGTYSVTVTDANGCTSVQNILFTELDCPIPVVTLPASLPATLDCESADSYATTDLATYTNGETGNCELSGTLSPNDIRDYDVCNGGTITVTYFGADACGNDVDAQHVITVTPAAVPTVTLPAGLPCHRLWIVQVPIAIQQVIMLLIRIVRVAHV